MNKPYNESPGPASYAPKPYMGGINGPNRFTFTAKPRTNATYGDDTPGPAAYSKLGGAMGGQKFSFGARPVEVPGGNNVPGPGQYDTVNAFNKGRKGKAFSMTGRPPPTVIGEDIPGPGQYSVVESYQKSRTHGPSYSMQGKHRRVEINDIPGPAAYNYQPKMGGTSFSFKGKYVNTGDGREEGPGPGKYFKELKQTVGPQWSLSKRYPQHDTTFAYTELAKQMMLKGY